MRNILLFLCFIFALQTVYSQSCQDASVELSAVVQTSPPQITLNWLANAGATQYQVFRKLKSATSWGYAVATYAGTTNQHIDTDVSIAESYEYKVVRTAATYTGYGYINAGIEIPVVENRGKLILIIDNTLTSPCESEISQLIQDLEGDGWMVIRHDVSPYDAVTSIKSLIVNDYYQSPTAVKAVYLLGHVPVPYSGNLYPDGHPDHQGAWPADVYYGDVDGVWTDNIVNNTVANDSRNDNIPGDGKFDQSSIPSDVELQVGRVDFNNMPAFAAGTVQLIKNYLNKAHEYRHKVFNPLYQALVDDNFGYFGGEAFAASGWKNEGPLVNPANSVAADYFTAMSSASYRWSYGCGGGWYQGSSGIGNTDNFAASNLQGVFTLLFGSYFGDWDTPNNFLRAALAQGRILTNAWSGRPHWQFHHMGLGENIGYSARVSQNNNSLYTASYGARFVHIALMGDPALRNDVVAPPTNLTATLNGNHGVISWTASTDAVAGYYIYMKNDQSTQFIRLNTNPVIGTSYTDSCLASPGTYTYMVKAIRLENQASGSYYNLSQGISDTLYHPDNLNVTASASFTLLSNIASFTNTSVNATSYFWDFGDGTTSTEANPVHAYNPGTFNVTLTATNDCDAEILSLTIVGEPWNTLSGTIRYANSTNTVLSGVTVTLNDSSGAVIGNTSTDLSGHYSFSSVPAGTYTLHAATFISPQSINSTDALITLRHFVHVITLDGLFREVADVDNNNLINSLDALLISRRFTGQITTFTAGDWFFEPAVIQVQTTGSYTQDLTGICYGDVNGSYVPAQKDEPAVILDKAGILNIEAGTSVDIPLVSGQLLETGAISLVLEYPTECLDISQVTMPGNSGFIFHVTGTQLRFGWYSLVPKTFQAGDTILVMRCMVKSSETTICNQWTATSESQVADPDGILIPGVHFSLPTLILKSDEFMLYQNIPNPFATTTSISYYLPESGHVLLSICDLSGNLITTLVDQTQTDGFYTVTLPATLLAPGHYTCNIQITGITRSYSKSRKMVVGG